MEENKIDPKRYYKAVENFLLRNGCDILDKDKEFDFVCEDFKDIIFIDVEIRKDNFTSGKRLSEQTRSNIETKMIKYLKETNLADRNIRYDEIQILVLSDERALIRHHVNALQVI